MLVTHNGPFHADDVMATALVRLFVHGDIDIIRTRDAEKIAAADIVIDVGGVYDAATNRFDHHQFRTTEDRVRSRFMPAVPLSSAGMVLEWLVDREDIEEDVARILYRDLVADIDLHDNGEAAAVPEGFPMGASLSMAISRFNPSWDGGKDFDADFVKAVEFATVVLDNALRSAEAEVKAVNIVKAAAAESPDEDVLQMPLAVPNARNIVVDLELPHSLIVHPSDFGGWMVMTVPPSREDMFSQRVPLPENWAGKRGEELNAALAEAGIDQAILDEGHEANASAVFTHTGRFCGGHGTKDASLAMAKAALALR